MLPNFKKLLLSCAVVIAGIFQSCSVESKLTYHNDKTISMLTNVDMKELMNFANAMGSDTAKADKMAIGEYQKDWKSVYDIEMGKRQKGADSTHTMPTDSTAVAVLKKIFIKSIVDDSSKFTGISMKFDRLSPTEMETLAKKGEPSRQNKLETYDFTCLKNWDGKTLVIESDELERFFNGKPDAKKKAVARKAKKKTKEIDEIRENMKDMMKFINMKFITTCKFENKIKSIEGKHDWIKQADEQSIQITLSSEQLLNENQKLQHKVA